MISVKNLESHMRMLIIVAVAVLFLIGCVMPYVMQKSNVNTISRERCMDSVKVAHGIWIRRYIPNAWSVNESKDSYHIQVRTFFNLPAGSYIVDKNMSYYEDPSGRRVFTCGD